MPTAVAMKKGRKKYGPMKKKPGQKGYKTEQVMREFGTGMLHSGSKTGPKVKKRKQAIAIALNQERKSEGKGKAKSVAKRSAKQNKKKGRGSNRLKRNIGRA
jgi:hypothetical protein